LAIRGYAVSISVANNPSVVVVLVVEDEFFVRTDIADCLRAAGYQVVESASGEEAVALCNSELSIDMVFTDINLGGAMTGWAVTEYFRIERPGLPVLYTSGQPVDTGRCGPGTMFVAKPYHRDDILRACERLCG
jgi:CheY-like chemotaxis protein